MHVKTIPLLFFLLVLHVKAHCNDLTWREGVIVLNSGEMIGGEIHYDFNHDITKCIAGEKIRAFSPYLVNYFKVFDEGLEINRFFKSIDENCGSVRKKAFYEIVLDGTLPVVRRKKPNTDSQYIYYSEDYSFERKDFNYYVISDGKLISLTKFKKNIIEEIMAVEKPEILAFIRRESLNYTQLKHQIIIIDFYNSLKDPYYKALPIPSKKLVE